jgi:hypothetical protein
MKIRISNKLYNSLPIHVANRVRQVAEDHHIKSFEFFNHEQINSDKKFYVGEGERFYGIHSDGREAHFEAVAGHNVGAAGVTHKIGAEFTMPAGSYLIQVYYYDKFYMTVYAIKES